MTGLGELRPGDDLVAELARCAPWLADGDILVVTSKIVSKVEGRLLPVPTDDPAGREAVRQQAIADETVRVVARRGSLRVVETRHGLVLAAAGVDASNVRPDEIALLPLDPDASARRLVDGLRERTGRTVAVVISDSVGRPWRHGIADVAIGVAGLTAVLDVRGETDRYGNELVVTEVAVADELAAAGDLVKGKLSDVPVAVIRGLRYSDDGKGSSSLIRGSVGDLFRLGTAEAMALGQAQAGSDPDGGGCQRPARRRAGHAGRDGAGSGRSGRPVRGPGRVLRPAGGPAGRHPAQLRARPPDRQRAAAGSPTGSGCCSPCIPGWAPGCNWAGTSRTTTSRCWRRRCGRPPRRAGSPASRWIRCRSNLDVHPITCSLGIPTRHYDVQFLGRAPAGAEPVISSESDDLRWFAVDRTAAELRRRTAPADRPRRRPAMTGPLDQLASWPVPNCAAAVVGPAGVLATAGDRCRCGFRWRR